MDVESSEDQALALMKEDIPDYLQNNIMLLACGYDKMSTLAEFDVHADIDKMLEYINDTFTDHSM